MAGSTTNLGLIKPLGSEKIRIAQFNQNSDTLDAAIGAVGSTSLQAQVGAIEDGIAIVANGDSHVAITAGQFVYVRNNTHNLAEGLYVASANVSANGSITSSNMTADASGGLNALNSKINENVVNRQATVADCNDMSIGAGCFRIIATTVNWPLTGSYGVLFNMFGLDYLVQIAASISSSRMWFRKRSGGIWADWIELATKNDINTLDAKVFNTTSYAGGSSSYEITCPTTINDGSNFFALLKHFGATGVYNIDLVLLIRSGNNLYYSYIVHNSSANITAASYSGNKITLTFNANVYMSAHVIVTQ